MNKDYLLIDLDGTVTDSRVGVTKSVQYSLTHFGIHVADADELIGFIGPPLRDSYQKYYGIIGENAEKAIEKYREYYSDRGIYENELYEGMDKLLRAQFEKGRKIILATSKAAVYAKKILEHFEIDKYFCFAAGAEFDGTRSRKDEVIRYALDSVGITSMDRAIMVGDKRHDIIGAKTVGMESIGVLYGYGDFDELSAAGADYIAGSVEELSVMLG